MTIIHQTQHLTLQYHDFNWGHEYRLTDGMHSCSFSTQPEIDQLEEIWEDYLQMKMDSELVDECFEKIGEDEAW